MFSLIFWPKYSILFLFSSMPISHNEISALVLQLIYTCCHHQNIYNDVSSFPSHDWSQQLYPKTTIKFFLNLYPISPTSGPCVLVMKYHQLAKNRFLWVTFLYFCKQYHSYNLSQFLLFVYFQHFQKDDRSCHHFWWPFINSFNYNTFTSLLYLSIILLHYILGILLDPFRLHLDH